LHAKSGGGTDGKRSREPSSGDMLGRLAKHRG
jgi:hypothetical protein